MTDPIVYTPTRGTRLEYERRVNRVMDHVRAHLAEPLPLAALARVGALSPFHFHRMFHALTGETPAAYVQRQRLDKAAGALTARRKSGVLEIAVDHGFGSAAAFARAFRAHLGMAARSMPPAAAVRLGVSHDDAAITGAFHCTYDACDDRPCVEIYRGAPADRPTGTFQCELALPVRPL